MFDRWSCADFKNVSIVAHYIKERTKNAQFVIISLRNNMFELADRLVRTSVRACRFTPEIQTLATIGSAFRLAWGRWSGKLERVHLQR